MALKVVGRIEAERLLQLGRGVGVPSCPIGIEDECDGPDPLIAMSSG
ncbi:hypothetical protein [Bradyrhizobium sp. 170]|nr:hypothetical protein [Bradyrhizobium sp. 170]UPK05781.1 hypothetical protein IVB05_09465 [Bradyrhizobium sp. 170]